MAKKRPVLARVLGARSVAAVAYGEIGSSLFIALGIVAFLAGGLLPWVLLGVGAIFFLVSLSYAEGVSAIPETGGGPMLVRRAFNDPAGLLHRLGAAPRLPRRDRARRALRARTTSARRPAGRRSTKEPWDGIVGVVVILGVAALRLARRSQLYRIAQGVAGLALLTQLVVLVVGFAFVFDPSDVGAGVDIGTNPELARPLLRARRRHARLHRARDGGELRGRDDRAGTLAAEEPVRRRRRGRRDRVPAGHRRASPSPSWARRAWRAARGDRRRGSRLDLRHRRRRAVRLRRGECGDRPDRRRDDVHLRRRPAHARARPARDAPRALRPPQPAHADRAGRDRLRRAYSRAPCCSSPTSRAASCASSRASTASACCSRSSPRSWRCCDCAARSRSSSARSARRST